MTKYSRIQKICSFVDASVIAEIGADHAYITKQLFENGKINFAYVTDISEKCLQKAVENLKEYKKCTYFSVGDGLIALDSIKSIQKTEQSEECVLLNINTRNIKDMQGIDDIVLKKHSYNNKYLSYPVIQQVIIAGMGGQEIIKILKQDESKYYNNFILQPQKNIVEVRTFLQQNNFEILQDDLVQEDKMFYFILKVKRVEENPKPLTNFQLYFGNPTDRVVFKNYLTFELEKRENIAKQKKLIENETLIRIIKQYLLNL